MGNILTSISVLLLCISSILHGIVNRMQRKEIDRLEAELRKLKIKTDDIKTEMHIKYKELENWIK